MAPADGLRGSAARARERRVMMGGATIAGVALVLAYAVVPAGRAWTAREQRIDAASTRVAYLQTLVQRADALDAVAADAERALAGAPRRVLHARSSTLAASALQSLLQDAADASRVVVTRLEVSPEDAVRDDSAAVNQQTSVVIATQSASLPATLAAYGDIAGVTNLLALVGTGPRAVFVDRVSLQRNAALLGAPDVVQIVLTLRAPVLPP